MLLVGAHFKGTFTRNMFFFSLFTINNARSLNMRPLSIREAPRLGGTGGLSTGSGVVMNVFATDNVLVWISFFDLYRIHIRNNSSHFLHRTVKRWTFNLPLMQVSLLSIVSLRGCIDLSFYLSAMKCDCHLNQRQPRPQLQKETISSSN